MEESGKKFRLLCATLESIDWQGLREDPIRLAQKVMESIKRIVKPILRVHESEILEQF